MSPSTQPGSRRPAIRPPSVAVSSRSPFLAGDRTRRPAAGHRGQRAGSHVASPLYTSHRSDEDESMGGAATRWWPRLLAPASMLAAWLAVVEQRRLGRPW